MVTSGSQGVTRRAARGDAPTPKGTRARLCPSGTPAPEIPPARRKVCNITVMKSRELHADSADAHTLAARYGGPALSPRLVRGLVIVLAVLFLALIGWMGLRFANVDVRAETISYEHTDSDRLTVTFQVTMRPGTEALCRVQALDDGRAQVGFVEVPIPAQDSSRSVHTVQIATQGHAVSGSVLGCERT